MQPPTNVSSNWIRHDIIALLRHRRLRFLLFNPLCINFFSAKREPAQQPDRHSLLFHRHHQHHHPDKMSYSENKEVNSNIKAVPKQGTSTTEDPIQGSISPPKDEAVGHQNRTGEVNMEAGITSEEVIRAGGFGARDDLSSFLPVASDATDFEETLLDARDYEEPQPQVPRPGLGWKDPKEPY